MITRRTFLASALALPFIARGADKPALKLGIIADPQYADAEPVATRFYRQSIGKLHEAIEHFNGKQLDFCVNCGDTIDHKWDSFKAMLEPLAACKHKFYHQMGNHDFEVLESEKLKVPTRLGMPARYYTIEREGFVFAMVDTNDVSIYAYPALAKETANAFEELKKVAATGVIHGVPWNGAVGETQMKWLEDTCRKAAAAQKKVIVFAHHPIFPMPHSRNEWNSDALLKLIDRNRNVVAWINGHNHDGNFGVRDDVPYITIHGMVETPNTNSFATADIFADRLVMNGHGREPSREIKFRTA